MLFLSVSVSVEAKELKTCRSLVEANCATVKSDDCFALKSNDSLHFHSSSLLVEANNSKSVLFGAADPSTSPTPPSHKKEAFSTFLPQCGLYESLNLP